MNDEVAITVIATGFGEGLDEAPVNYSNFQKKSPQEVVTTENGLTGRSVTLGEIFEETKDEDQSNSRFDLPDFLSGQK